MGPAESERRPAQHAGSSAGASSDIQLTWRDRDSFRQALARVFPDETHARHLVRGLRGLVAGERIPGWADGGSGRDWWTQLIQHLDLDIGADPFRRLLGQVVLRYGFHPVFTDLRERYLDGADAPAAAGACHVIVRADDDEQRRDAAKTLADLGLDPVEVWTTARAASYALSSADHAAVRRTLEATDLGWTLVPPGSPNSLLSELFVQGPDGSRFRITDAPAMESVRNVVHDVMQEYDRREAPDVSVPAVADRVDASGERHRLDIDDTLYGAGIRDGDSLAVGIEGRAGAVDPLVQQDALDRVFHDIMRYAAAHPGIAVRANRVTRATEYEVDFTVPSLGPPPEPDGEPARIDRHTVLIQLGPGFPMTPPSVYWLTPIFHPNVFPNYDGTQSLTRPDARGYVCLGMFAESWVPSTDFGGVLQLLVAMAGYRNYELFDFSGIAAGAEAPVRANFFDQAAAAWVLAHQADIEALGGVAIARRAAPATYTNVVVRLERDAIAPAG